VADLPDDLERLENAAANMRARLARLEGRIRRLKDAPPRRATLHTALQQIADMDPNGIRADDLGRAARTAREALSANGVKGLDDVR
jgi:hypothetical protein